MSDKSKSTVTKTRSFATIVYPESAIENWLEIISTLKINCFVSPLHDKDINEDGTIKKAHYHVQFIFDGPKTLKQCIEIANKINGVGIELVNSVRGMARYLCHLDNPEKAQYSPEDIKTFGSDDYFEIIALPSDKYKNIKEMISWCNENNCIYYSDLFNYAMANRDDWFRTLCDNGTYVVKEYLKAQSFKRGKMQ